jgi:bifunctional DNase/RNase
LVVAGGGGVVALAAAMLLFVILPGPGRGGPGSGIADAQEMVVAAVISAGPEEAGEVVVLRSLEGEALVPVRVSPAEGARIRDGGSAPGEPSLLEEAVAAFGGTIEAAVLDGNGGFELSARLVVDREGSPVELEASAAEAIAAAVEAERPIFTTRRALEASGLTGEDLARIHEGLPGSSAGGPSVSM